MSELIYEYGEQALRDLEEYLEFRAFRDIDKDVILDLTNKIHRWKMIYDMEEAK